MTLNKVNRETESEQSAPNLFQQPGTRKTSSNSSALLNLSLLCFINPGNLKPSILQNRKPPSKFRFYSDKYTMYSLPVRQRANWPL